MMSAEEVEKELTEQFSDVIATGNKGPIMKAVMPHFKGKADGKVINQAVSYTHLDVYKRQVHSSRYFTRLSCHSVSQS